MNDLTFDFSFLRDRAARIEEIISKVRKTVEESVQTLRVIPGVSEIYYGMDRNTLRFEVVLEEESMLAEDAVSDVYGRLLSVLFPEGISVESMTWTRDQLGCVGHTFTNLEHLTL